MGVLIYDGGFKDNLFDGYGKFYRDGKLEFEGIFVKNEPNGYGIKYKPDGNVKEEGEYLNGVLQK
jgi:antitoxin component YwqK of YwqJK toxin-antitoxin module